MRALVHEVAGGQFAHFARADEQDALAFERAEDFLGDGEGALQKPFEVGLYGAHLTADAVGFLDLPEDLRLADDHRIEAGCNTKQMPNGLAFAVFIHVGAHLSDIHAEELAEEAQEVEAGFFMTGEKLDAVTGGKHHGLTDAGKLMQRACGFTQALGRDGKLFPQLHRSRLVVHAREKDLHGVVYLCTELSSLAAQTQSINTKTALER